MITTMFLPLLSGRAPTSRTAATAAPELMPPGTPSMRASSRAVAKAASLLIFTTSSMRVRSRMGGAKPAPIPCILCGPGWPPDSTGESAGSTAMVRSAGLRDFNTPPTPVRVPPVPTPDTSISTLPSVSFQISSAVVRRWMAGLAAFSNCWGMIAPGVVAFSSSALAMAPFMPLAASVSTNSAPSRASILRRSIDIDSGITNMSRMPLAAATKASAMPVFPEVGSISTVPVPMRPSFSRASIMATPMRSFTLERGLKNSSFARILASTPCFLASLSSLTIGVSPMVSVIEL